ncbi:Coenzyme F420 hydrogenase/dehydrogenase, beta subunit C-terminal domain [Phocaeicola sp.]
MIQITNKEQCCGCSACASICSHDAITMKNDGLGFLYPVVDVDKCVECGLCENVCAFNDNYDRNLNLAQPLAFAVRHKNIHEIETSRSGAAFIAFSDWILAQGGVVYGVGYTDHFRVVHKRAMNKDERDEFKGSKYVQSDLGTAFRQVRKDLKNGLLVLFSGTPCQTSGLCSYIGKRLREKLYVIDIVCHGVPSPYIWRDYLDYLEKKEGKRIVSVNFRDKSRFGWKAHRESFLFDDHNTYTYTYTYTYYQHIMLRHSCAVCHFTNLCRPSDVTIADYWGWERTSSDFNADDKGCSLVLCNTEKGKVWFEQIKGDVYSIPAKLENVMQAHLAKPSDIHPKRMEFEMDYIHNGLVHALKKFGLMGWKYELRTYMRKVRNLGGRIKKVILKLWK